MDKVENRDLKNILWKLKRFLCVKKDFGNEKKNKPIGVEAELADERRLSSKESATCQFRGTHN